MKTFFFITVSYLIRRKVYIILTKDAVFRCLLSIEILIKMKIPISFPIKF